MTARLSPRLAFALFALTALAATSFSAVIVWGVAPAPVLALLAAVVVSGIFVAGASYLRDVVRAWRWNAGHRLR